MNYSETLTYLFSRLPAYHRIGKAAYKGNMDNTLALDNYFHYPHKNFRTIHVAGTNGKGSVSHMLASVLQEAGYNTALYTSPHLKDFRERIRINGVMIPEEEVIAFVDNNRAIIEKLEPSFFEITVAMAFDYFSRMKVDVAVIEVGMGGRLDSTNIITPVASVITNIGHDHMEFLGRTLAAVAGEKAGIIKQGVPVIIGETHPETKDVFIDRAASLASEINFADQDFKCTLGRLEFATGNRSWTLIEKSSGRQMQGITPLGGLAQEKNIQTLFSAVRVIASEFSIDESCLLKGIQNVIANTGLMGRWQILDYKPLTVCDTGHNKEGLEYVVKQIVASGKSRIHMVLGFVADKDLSSVLPLFPGNAAYYFTRASIPRALDENILRERAAEFGLKGESFHTVGEALASARKNAGPDDMIFIGGSTFVVAEVV